MLTPESANSFYAQNRKCLHDRLAGEVSRVHEDWYDSPLDPRVEKALRIVPRHEFVQSSFARAYRDVILPLDRSYVNAKLDEAGFSDHPSPEETERLKKFLRQHSSTASQPSVIARMTEMVLPETSKTSLTALDIGSGTGYQTAILRALGFDHVTSIERKQHLVDIAQSIFQSDPHVTVLCQDGKFGLPGSKFDAIVVGAQTNQKDVVFALSQQLTVGGKMALPLSAELWAEKNESLASMIADGKLDPESGILTLITREDKNAYIQELIGLVTFVDLV